MIALVDIGNTNIKWSLIEDDEIFISFVTSSNIDDAELNQHLTLVTENVATIVIVSVVPAMTEMITKACASISSEIEVSVLDYQLFKELIKIDIDATVLAPGPDRLANACELICNGEFPALAIDVGSAITTEIIDSNGTFIGGTIAPGESLQKAALDSQTSELHKAGQATETTTVIGKDSASAIASGINANICWGSLGILKEAEKTLAQPFKNIVVTGGMGQIVCDFLIKQNIKVVYDSKHTIKGILSAYKLFKKGNN